MSSVLQKRRKQQKENLQNKQKESPSSDSGNQYDESSSTTNSYYTFDNNPQFEDIPEFNVTEDIKQQQEMEALRNSNSMNGLLNSLMSAMNSNPQNGMTPMDVLNACMPSFSNQPNTCPEPQPHSHSADHPKDFVERLYVFLNKHNVLLDMFCGVILIACQFNKFVFNALLVCAALLYTTVYLFTPKETKTKSMIYRVIGITLTLFFPQFNTPGYQFFFYSVFDIFWFVLSRYFRFVLYQRLSCYFYPTYQRVYVHARSLQSMAGEKIEVYRESVTTTQLATIMGGLLLSLVLILLLSKWIHKIQEKKRLNAIIYEYLSVAKQIQKPGTKDSLLQSFLRSYEQLTETPEEQFRSQVLSLWDQNYNEIFIDKDKKTN